MELSFSCRCFVEADTAFIPPSYIINERHCELLIKNAPHLVSFEANIYIENTRKNISFGNLGRFSVCLFSANEN